MIPLLAFRVLPALGCVAILVALRLGELGVAGRGPGSATVALGFLLLAAFLAGNVAASVRLPRITGYLLVGLVVGPNLTALLTTDMMAAGKAATGIAVALIALTAGGELRVDWVRRQLRPLLAISGACLLIVFTCVFGLVFALSQWFPLLEDATTMETAIVAMVFGAIAVSCSPTVTIAMIGETRSDGPLSRTVLGVTIVTDLAVIVLFAAALAVAQSALGDGTGGSLTATLIREIGGSIALGAVVGAGMGWFLDRIDRDVPVFVLAVCFGISELALELHLEALLIALTAGIWVENVSRRGHQMLAGISRLSLPVYALFFAAAGAKVDLAALASMWPLAVSIALVRAGGLWAGARAGAALTGAHAMVTRYGWLGLVSQAGVSLALAATVARTFPDWGGRIQALLVAIIALHELIGPLGFQHALRRAGEVGKADADEGAPSAGH